MNATDPDETKPPATRAQFPLWFLLFVIPTIAGLAIAIYTNWHQQAQVRADLIAHREVLREKIATMESEIALVEQVDQQIRWHAYDWKSPTAVVQHLKNMRASDETPREGFYEVVLWPIAGTFFVQADTQDLEELLQRMREAYPESDPQAQFLMLELAVNIPVYAPDSVSELTEPARQLVEIVPEDGSPKLKQQASRIRTAFDLGDTSSVERGEAS